MPQQRSSLAPPPFQTCDNNVNGFRQVTASLARLIACGNPLPSSCPARLPCVKDNKEHRSTQEMQLLPAPLLQYACADEPPEDGLWFNIGFGIGFGGGQGMSPPSM
ncbi:hypothetical protein [Paenibacillus polymyxa]|uniref:hypothetical protein n=1 Tax=Paenibacillus polymyxa TaxID=1406 RepID=UPI002349F9F5|nr:hypothetical protein [Paenibacillus polymyxa]WCM60699.1 hypothetical protein OYT09_22515 [Paenibacillus polymyxa]